ncbi:BREX-2 system adenine-specific DNA-methyltransferase PglX [Nocardia amamiensis]|uniref:BREX-2 system adenine-specific DNA-methyltransferase PglX n=1 Tax=Nocardia amamiensis TaxID=404578 RepID=UPI0033D2449A
MTGIDGLVPALRKLVLTLEDDLRARVDGADVVARQDGVYPQWHAEYDEAFMARRTAAPWEAWRDERVSQSAVAWVLLTVFARYVEDNALVTPRWIAGATPDERRNAVDARQAYFAEQTTPEFIPSDREWLEQIITHFARYDATRALVDDYSPLHRVAPSGDAARAILEFWWDTDASGEPRWSFTGVDSRFLGDVYQNLSEYAKKTYALLQTPEFVEEFILDQTLTPALAERPLEGFTVIDPTCGSGHFLLGAFRRLLREWERQAPALPVRVLVGKALGSVYGVDINAAAVAIARFRLLLAALESSGGSRIEQAVDFELNLATGDSLLWGARKQALTDDLLTIGLEQFAYSIENSTALKRILQREHDVVVGNPPYVSVKDPATRELYRQHYEKTCHGKYVLTVPFMELFFELAKSGDIGKPGRIGKITSNSFMKRQFGAKLIESYLATKDLRQIIDSEGVWIPGHNADGTPTVIIVATARSGASLTVRTVLTKGLREVPSVGPLGNGPAWVSITDNINNPGFENDWISVVDLPRKTFHRHPWSLSGGGAVELLGHLDAMARTSNLGRVATDIGITAVTGEDDFFMTPTRGDLIRLGWPSSIQVVEGDDVRNWGINSGAHWGGWPYDKNFKVQELDELGYSGRWLTTYRNTLNKRKRFGVPMVERGFKWYEWQEVYPAKLRSNLSITFAEISTHNHFSLDRGGRIFKQTAPVIKLPRTSTEDDYTQLLGLLNSSVACFWIREKFKAKGGAADQLWLRTYQLNSTGLQNFPLPSTYPHSRASIIQKLSDELLEHSIPKAIANSSPDQELISSMRNTIERAESLMIAHQEELDWECYRLYDIIDEDLTYSGELPGLSLGERAFEIMLARNMAMGRPSKWFTEHKSTPTEKVPAHLPVKYQDLLQRRLQAIAENPYLRLLENPEYKRRWETEPWNKRVSQALRGWLLDRVEDRALWFDRDNRPTPKSVAQLADELDRDPDFPRVLRMWAQSPEASTSAALKKLLAEEGVPFLAAYRYKPSGLETRKAWEHTWAEQRREDAGETLEKSIPVPPRYKPADFTKPSYWSRRGKLDVPKERFISYPNANRPEDNSELLGWAGWNHAEQALALAGIIGSRIQDGATEATLIPLVAGLLELSPWVRQWHSEIDLEYGISMADLIEEEIRTHCAELGISPEDAAAWRPEPTGRGRRRTGRIQEPETLL